MYTCFNLDSKYILCILLFVSQDIQRTINRAAVTVLRCSLRLWKWDQRHLSEEKRNPFFEDIGKDTQIVKTVLLLTGSIQGTKNQVNEYLQTFIKYDWLWKHDKDLMYRKFMERNPRIEDFEMELSKFLNVESEIERIAPVNNIGALSLNTHNLKLQLRNECRQWKVQYSDNVHQKAREQMTALFEYMRTTMMRLNREATSLETLRQVMAVLRELRERESSIEMEFLPIENMYQILEHHLPGGYMDKEEMDMKSIMRSTWRKLVDHAEEVADSLARIQGVYKKQLMKDLKDFSVDATQFRQDFLTNGPMVAGLKPREAVNRLNRFKNEFQILEHKLEGYKAGEDLFGLKPTEYPDLVKTKKELGLLDTLYSLYMDVVHSMEEWRAMTWTEASERMDQMMDIVKQFEERCKRMPSKLRDWDAYRELKKEIADFNEVI